MGQPVSAQQSEANDGQLIQVCELGTENFLLCSFCEDLLVLGLVQSVGTSGPEECSQAKLSKVENIYHT